MHFALYVAAVSAAETDLTLIGVTLNTDKRSSGIANNMIANNFVR